MTEVVGMLLEFPEPMPGGRDNEAVADRRKFEIPLTHLVSSEYASILTPPAVPDQVLLGSLRDGRFRVMGPIAVKCTAENQDVIVEAIELNEFGFGRNLSEALSDLQAAIVELYFTLEQEQDRLGPDLQRIWAILQQKVLRRP